jgi:hypothetical protein
MAFLLHGRGLGYALYIYITITVKVKSEFFSPGGNSFRGGNGLCKKQNAHL